MRLFSAFVTVCAILGQLEATRIICYYRSWTSYTGYNPEDFNANLCTHINYAFVGIQNDGNLQVVDDGLDVGQGLYKRVTGLKSTNPNLKVLLSVGGGTAGGAAQFAQMAQDAGKRATFINSAKSFMTTYGFDGIDLDWELPTASTKGDYLALLSEMRNSFGSQGYLLTAAVSSTPGDGYDVPQMNQLLDWINIMTYDFYAAGWSSYTGQNSALFPSSVESDYERNNLNVAAGIRNWINAGANVGNLAAGLAFYARSFSLTDPNQHGLHAPFNGPGVGNEGTLNYFEMCQRPYSEWTRVWDDEQKNPYRYNGNNWIGYDDMDSICAKVQYAKSQGVGGVMIWAIDGDDVHGDCGETQALLKNVNTCLK